MVPDQIYHDLIMPLLCAESGGCEMGHLSYNRKTRGVVVKWEGPILKGGGCETGPYSTILNDSMLRMPDLRKP